MRPDKCFIGTEEIEPNLQDKGLLVEEALFLLIGAGCVVFFLTHPDLTKTLLGLFIFLVLSPFGAHLMAKCLTHILKRIRCVIQNCEK
jgi:hypothetical protein